MITPAATLRRTFSSLGIRNYRLFFLGQIVSVSGIWMQRVAQSWLVLDLTGSGTAVGLVTALQFLPMLFLAPLGGVIADRLDKRRLLGFTQPMAAAISATLGVLVVTDAIELWMVYVLAAALGVVGSIDNPSRQSFVVEMVGREDLTNAVSLNAVMVNLARVVGPAAAGAIIIAFGTGPCFLINAASYFGLVVALRLMREGELTPVAATARGSGRLREGLAYVAATPAVLTPLLLMAVVGTFAYEYQVVLPLFARFTFGGNAGTYATMTATMGAGAMIGGLITAWRRTPPAAAMARIAAVFGAVQLLVSLAPTLLTALIGLFALGAVSIGFLAVGNSTLQLAAAPEMRGRVMGLWAVAFVGSTPVGGPIVGWVGEHVGARYALGMGGVATAVAALFAMRSLVAIDSKVKGAVEGIEIVPPTEKLGP